MKQGTRKKSPLLGQKLKQAVQNLTVDVFGYEPKVKANVLAYFTQLSKETGIPKDRLVVRIFRDRGTVRTAIYNHGRLVKEIPISELIILFTNATSTGLFDLEAKVKYGIQAFMKDFSREYSMDVDQLHICIMTGIESVWVKGYEGIKQIKDIPLRVLIKHFMK